jgi:hypothetical protein
VNGWIKLHRQLIERGWLKNHNVCIFWIYCLLKATHEPIKTIVGFQEVNLQPGEFVFGRHKASKETGLSERKIRTCLAFLRNAENLTIKTTNKFSIISITNWHTYQRTESENDQQNDQQATSRRPQTRTKEQKKKTLRDSPNPAVAEFLKFFGTKFQEKFGQTYTANFGKDGNLIKGLLKIHSPERLKELAERFFNSKDEFIQRSGFTIGVFNSQANKLVAEGRKQRDPYEGLYGNS